ncbi:MAG: M14 family metallopeptidase [Bacteroidales bacterium]
MKIKLKLIITALSALVCTSIASGQAQYADHQQLTSKLKALVTRYPGMCSFRSLAKTAGGKDIWLITVGTGETENKPAVAVVGGVEGSYILGRELAAGFAVNILENSAEAGTKDLLNKITFYILPDVNPDASETYFSALKYERNINSLSTDDDRDFTFGEDPCEDLNKDGYISLIRIQDPAGTYIESDEDKRIMVRADLSKGQTGGYLVYSEGIDNDKDSRWNEDGEGGVNFNRNLTYNYEEFGAGSGMYPVSEPEVKAVLDFLYDRFNIYALFTFGPQDNLGQPMKSQERTERSGADQAPQPPQGPDQGRMRMSRKFTSILGSDELLNKLVSEKYHEITGAKGAPASVSSPGNFMEWAYFHYGRYSFGTPGWWFPVEKGKNQEATFLKFAEKNGINDVFIPWTEISHPDFPGKKAEAGGLKPFVIMNPPADTLGDLITAHYKFITSIASMHPELEILDIKTEDAGENIFRLSLKVHNKGIFATCAEAGDQNIWTRIMRITLDQGKGQSILSGLKVQRVQRLQGDETAEFSWLISGKGPVIITAGAANTGSTSAKVDLR